MKTLSLIFCLALLNGPSAEARPRPLALSRPVTQHGKPSSTLSPATTGLSSNLPANGRRSRAYGRRSRRAYDFTATPSHTVPGYDHSLPAKTLPGY